MQREKRRKPREKACIQKRNGSSTVCATLELGSAKIRWRNIKNPLCWERGASRRPHVPSRAERRLRDDVGVAVGDFVCGMFCVCRESDLAGCGLAGVRYANGFHGKLRCSGDLPPGHAAYAPLASRRNSKKLPSPPFKAARPLRGCGYFLETLRSGVSVRLRRTHPCAYGSCCFRLCRHCAPFSGRAGTRLRYRHTGAAAP